MDSFNLTLRVCGRKRLGAIRTVVEERGLGSLHARDGELASPGLALRDALYTLHEYDSASHDFVKTAQLNAAPELFKMAAKSLEAQGNILHAIESYESELAVSPNGLDARQEIDALRKMPVSG